MSVPRAALSWSSGKDCTFTLMELRRTGAMEVASLLTTTDAADGRAGTHGTRDALLAAQAAAVGLPLIEVPLPQPCPNDVYLAGFAEAAERLAAEGIRDVVFGDIFLEDVRAWRETHMAGIGLTSHFPLWGRDTSTLAREMIAGGIVAHLVSIDTERVPEDVAGAAFDAALLAALPDTVDPCGERGEFHTAVTDAPVFAEPIPVRRGGITRHGSFLRTELIPQEA